MKRWYNVSSDPISPEALQFRKENLIAARSNELISNRIDYFCDLARDKDILDVGVVEHTRDAVHSPQWLHQHLSKVAKTCLGIDILEEDVKYLQSLGYNIICQDITRSSLVQTFDIVICGDVLEHVESPGFFLKSLATMLNPNGRLVVSIPNPWYINVLVKTISDGYVYVDNVDHVAWFDPSTLCEMGQRYGLKLDKFTGIEVNELLNWRTRLLFGLSPLLIRLGIHREIFAKTMVYEFVTSD
jgi:2-polyprenyl-3-methyl-5-hydroxy-6-metoxy-1,4-benzoquinol methylase